MFLFRHLILVSTDYMVEKLGIERGKIDTLSNLLYKNYGTTMAGLRVGFYIYVTFPCLLKWRLIKSKYDQL